MVQRKKNPESFELRFKRNGATIPVTGLEPGEGIILDGETGAWPNGVGLQFQPITPGTRKMWETIQRRRGLPSTSFPLRMSRAGDCLRFEGLKPDELPPGDYRAAVFVGGYRFHTRLLEFTIPKNGSVSVEAEEKPERRHVTLVETVDRFDDLTRDIVMRSDLDGMSMANWLNDSSRRDSRKACVLNILAKLRARTADQLPLSEGVRRIFLADVDRIYVELVPGFSRRILASSSFFTKDLVVHTTHNRLLTRIPNGKDYGLESFRENVTENSLQLAFALPDNPADPECADIDIDLGNPFTNPLGFFIHIGELLDPGKTDHLALFTKLKNSSASDFLYYEVVES